jgi:hypothetical protein
MPKGGGVSKFRVCYSGDLENVVAVSGDLVSVNQTTLGFASFDGESTFLLYISCTLGPSIYPFLGD